MQGTDNDDAAKKWQQARDTLVANLVPLLKAEHVEFLEECKSESSWFGTHGSKGSQLLLAITWYSDLCMSNDTYPVSINKSAGKGVFAICMSPDVYHAFRTSYKFFIKFALTQALEKAELTSIYRVDPYTSSSEGGGYVSSRIVKRRRN